MLFVIGETEFKNQRGEVVAYTRNTAIETDGAVQGVSHGDDRVVRGREGRRRDPRLRGREA